ncbi:DUF1214 domain-containing protein [Maricaulis sp. D1M11]|uniref:DUF1214 domain-containing protein n=1 Tax=Maricaulis sp. D1M11 TaxID=3076117 RepID=UPI0039B5D747
MIMRSFVFGVAGLALGGLVAITAVLGPMDLGGIAIGPWRTNLHIGAPDAPATVRAIIARKGLLALNRSETVYFSADQDSHGDALDEACRYDVVFDEAPAAYWWSLTVYAQDDFLAVNGEDAHSVHADTMVWSDNGRGVVAVGHPSAENGLSTRNGGAFNLTLRLYLPDETIAMDPRTATLPRINRLGCGDES